MHFWRDFRKFVTRGNLVDLAVGFTVGAAFTTIARSLVDDIIMPPVGLLMGQTDFRDYFFVLKPGANAGPYLTLAQAKAAGAVTLNFGLFVNAMLAFFLVGLAMFMISQAMSRAEAKMDAHFEDPTAHAGDEPTEKKCAYCRSVIPIKACRCPHCTSHLAVPGRPDLPADDSGVVRTAAVDGSPQP